MKKIILVILFGTLTIQIKAQLKADAGFNLFLCDSFGKSIIAPLISNRTNKLLGGNPTAWGGIPPYKYKWTFSYKTILTSKPYIYASDILNDTSIANPIVKDGTSSWFYSYPTKTFTVILEVKDSLGFIAKDSVDVIQSLFYYKMVSERFKTKFDTISFESNIGRGVNPLKYSWSPRSHLLDSNSNPMRTYSPFSVKYTSIAIDSLGCKAIDNIDLIVSTSNISEVEISKIISNFHNPISSTSTFEINKNKDIKSYELYNTLGQKIYSQNLIDKIEIGKLTSQKGMYFLIFYFSNGCFQLVKIERN